MRIPPPPTANDSWMRAPTARSSRLADPAKRHHHWFQAAGHTDRVTYGPHTDLDRQHMLAALGIDSIDALFADIPASVRATGLDLPAPVDELTLARRLEGLASRNRVGLASFLGAGAYRHHIPPTVDQILSRGEFYTSYTPYQPEISQGTLQTIYEYQSL